MIIFQEDEIGLRNVRLLSSQLIESNREAEILELDEPRDETQVSLSERVDSYFEKKDKGLRLEPKELKGCPPYLSQPFNFYGGYVGLNLKEKATVAESSLLVFYKELLVELTEKNKVLSTSLSLLKELNQSYYEEAFVKDEKLKTLSIRIEEQDAHLAEVTTKHEGRVHSMMSEFFAEKKQIEEGFDAEKKILQEELRLNEVIKD